MKKSVLLVLIVVFSLFGFYCVSALGTSTVTYGTASWNALGWRFTQVSGATSYEALLYDSSGNLLPNARINSITSSTRSDPSTGYVLFTGLSPGTTYCVKINATGGGGESESSSKCSTTYSRLYIYPPTIHSDYAEFRVSCGGVSSFDWDLKYKGSDNNEILAYSGVGLCYSGFITPLLPSGDYSFSVRGDNHASDTEKFKMNSSFNLDERGFYIDFFQKPSPYNFDLTSSNLYLSQPEGFDALYVRADKIPDESISPLSMEVRDLYLDGDYRYLQIEYVSFDYLNGPKDLRLDYISKNDCERYIGVNSRASSKCRMDFEGVLINDGKVHTINLPIGTDYAGYFKDIKFSFLGATEPGVFAITSIKAFKKTQANKAPVAGDANLKSGVCEGVTYDFSDMDDIRKWRSNDHLKLSLGGIDGEPYLKYSILNPSDPFMRTGGRYSPYFDAFEIRYKSYSNGPEKLKLFYMNARDGCWKHMEQCTQSWNIKSDGQWNVDNFRVNDSEWINGKYYNDLVGDQRVGAFRFDFDGADKAGDVYIDYIKFYDHTCRYGTGEVDPSTIPKPTYKCKQGDVEIVICSLEMCSYGETTRTCVSDGQWGSPGDCGCGSIGENLPGITDPTDVDGDGWNVTLDCNDNNAAVNPGALEICNNGVDDDCNASTVEDCTAGPEPLVDCTDSDVDEENPYYIKGTAVEASDGVTTRSEEDFCSGLGKLFEFSCGADGITYDIYNCPSNACNDGACAGKERVDDTALVSCEDGCLLNNNCYDVGYRRDGKYCSGETLEFVKQLAKGETCEESFQCNNNACDSLDTDITGTRVCVDRGIIRGVIDWFKDLFGGD